jgi:alpha-tubulin suppressor-like RCC1 family protein
LLLNGDVYSFGSGRLGQLGHGGHISSNIPLKISSLDNIVGIAAGANHSLVIKRRSNED